MTEQEMNFADAKPKVKRRGANVASEETRPQYPPEVADFAKEVIGRLVTFCGTVESGIDTIEGVPMAILRDPNERYFVKFFSSDGARAFLYLDQVAAFYTQQEEVSQQQQPTQQRTVLDMNAVDPSQLEGQSGPYYENLGEQYPDAFVRKGGAGSRPVRHIRRPSEGAK